MKRITAFLIAIMMLASIASAIPAAADGAFSDVGADRWSAGNIAYAVEKGYMQGVGEGKFDPEGTLTRAMVVTVLWRMSGSPAVAYRRAFTDVPDGEWFTSAVIWAKDKGVVNGVTVTSFDPNGAITREQLATMISRYASFLKYSVEPSGSVDAYPDASSVSDWAQDAMLWAVGEGLITGSLDGGKTLLVPGGFATRGQFAAILERFDKARENFSYILEYNHPVLMTSYTEKEYPLVEDADFYVSPDGNDGGSGSKTDPFATFARAAQAARAVPKTAEKGSVTVAFFAGDYPQPMVELTADDTGTAECPVVFCAYGDGEVRFVGGVTVSPDEFVPLEEADLAYIRENVADKVKKADLSGKPMSDGISPSSETFNRSYGRLDAGRYPNRNLYGEEVYVCRAVRSPSLGKLEVGFLKSRFSKYHTSEGMQLVGCFGHEYWKTVFPVTGYDKDTGIISYDVIGPQYGLDEFVPEVYFLNISEEVDYKNESWVDPVGKTLYVFEPSDEEYVVSATESFGVINGADHIRFVGLTFEGCTGDGFNITANDVTFDRCTIRGIGGRAGIRCYGTDFRMQDCEFAYTAGCGMWFDSNRPVEDLVPTGPYIDNCLIHDMGQKWKNLQNPGIRIKRAVGAVVSHCELYNTPCAAITFGYCAEGGEERAIDCVFEYNYIHDVDQDVLDIGCIYSGRSFINRDNIFRYNLISDVPGDGGKFAIYLDDGIAAQKIYGNIFYDFTDTAIMHSGGQYMDIHDNVFVQTKHVPSYTDSYGAVVAWDKYYGFAYDEEEANPTPWNSGNFRILYATLAKRPLPDNGLAEYYDLWHARWPELYEIIDDYDWPNFTDVTSEEKGVNNPNCPATPGFCSIYNNYAIGNCENRIGEAVERFSLRCENNPHL
ncbi:MAG: S-layer homology domain-containing protein, partial [Clostridia bacterium]|nr:S-layer homology domain-containing protein [Clostridia bacterium]